MTEQELELLHGYLNDALDASAFAELQTLLRRSAEARRVLRDLSTVDAKLHDLAENGRSMPPLPAPVSELRGISTGAGLFSRPLVTMIAGVLLGLSCASLVWAVAGLSRPEVQEREFPLIEADFESGSQPQATGVPRLFGHWCGDHASVVGGEQGITPRRGAGMLRLLRSDSLADPSGLDSHGADMMRLIDLRSLHHERASGQVVLELTASANMTPAATGEAFLFSIVLHAFSGDPAELSGDPHEVVQSAIATGAKRLILDGDPAAWQTGTARLLLPGDAEFVMVKLTITQKEPRRAGHVTFAGHYIDDVSLVARTQSEHLPKLAP